MKARVTIKGVTAIKKGRFNSQILLSVGDFVTAKKVMVPEDGVIRGGAEDTVYVEAMQPIENEVFDWLSSLQNRSVVISDE